MPHARDFVFGPWRAVPVLGVTQILAWGSLIYPPVLIVPLIAADRGWSLSFAMSGLSIGLFCAGLVALTVGKRVDRHGGHVVMTVGSLVGALGLVAIVHADSPMTYVAAWMVTGVGMAASLYDAAFATLGRIFGTKARRPITMLTFPGGLASTVSWPVTHLLITAVGWRGAYLAYAALLLLVAAPLHLLALPRTDARGLPDPAAAADKAASPSIHPARGFMFALVVAGFAAYAFIPSGLAAHLLAIFKRSGIDPGVAVMIGALFGPAQVMARLAEFALAGNAHPLTIVRTALATTACAFLLLAVAGIATPIAAVFSIMFGLSNGLVTIARGTVPLALFGASGYGAMVGRIAGPWLVMQSLAPLVMALVAERVSDAAALGLAACFAVVALACFWMIRRPA
jgi:MFS family permease